MWQCCVNVGLSLVTKVSLVWGVDSGGACAYVGTGGMGTVVSAQFCCAHETALKNKVNLKKGSPKNILVYSVFSISCTYWLGTALMFI